mgnify:FL=1
MKKAIKLDKTPDVINFKNGKISNGIKKDDEPIRETFKPTIQPIVHHDKILTKNGRVYVQLKNGFIKYADNGQIEQE